MARAVNAERGAALRALPVVPDRPGPVTVRLGRDVDQWPEIEIAFECAHARPTPEARRPTSYAREAIEALGGRLWVDRDDALSMRVRIALPPAQGALLEAPPPLRTLGVAGQPGAVLIVDDDDDLRESTTWLL